MINIEFVKKHIKLSIAVYSGIMLGAFSSTSLANSGTYTFVPPYPAAVSSTIPKWSGLYIGGSYSALAPGNKYYDTSGMLNPNTISSIRRVSLGYNSQDEYLVYGLSLSGEDYHAAFTDPRKIQNFAVSATMHSGFTLDNANSSILQNTLFYGLGGIRLKNIDFYSLTSIKNVQNALLRANKSDLDAIIGAGIEKKITSFLSVGAEYRYVFDIKNSFDYKTAWDRSRLSTGITIHF
ncbi:MAG: hypothetical protein EU981_02600 [Candidatus Liberibacter ctenarytainae]|uniref:Outer membrane protein OmpA-like transmembrane domain-containing protein n=1 Tax=Candidatus Liberibacter ctenarytainae TaxID=2020335 RepID=A0A937DLV6_9HYPH|nr:hypothetical protein [Candidatus Liberibacter ctenarytainae]